ncbi:sialidase-3-like [Morone saxatilis]|uniref:sialidase-3-like n=1 Tax=Morone saxatilis TaxID=34816 RepID=UPI0015E20C27|nr:sialidase-3-like [Morone saxatilis]
MGNRSSRDLKLKKQTVFNSWVYRIPALCYNEDQTLLAFAEKRKCQDDTSSKHLVMKTGTIKEENSKKTIEWSDFKEVKNAHLDGYRPMNPCPVYDRDNRTLFLFFTCVEGTVSEQWQIDNRTNKTRLCFVTTTDIGHSWSTVTDLTDTLSEIRQWATFAVGPGHGIQTESGRLIVPLYAYCISMDKCSCPNPYVFCLYRDKNDSWHLGKPLKKKSLECEMAEISDGKLYCNARSKGGYRVEALNMETLKETNMLVETGGGCQGSVVSFPAHIKAADCEPKWLLFSHPTDRSKRIDLGVYLNKSPMKPKAWRKPWIINRGPSGYSDLAHIGDGWFVCLMECGEQRETEQIASVLFTYDDLK